MLLAGVGAIGAAVVQIADATIVATSLSPTAASASYGLTSAGDILHNGADSGDWLSQKGAAPGGYEVRATLQSGAVTGGTTGVWEALTSNRTWSCTTTSGLSSAQLLIEIRLGTTVLDSAVINLSAEAFV